MSRWRPLEEEDDHSTESAADVNVTVKKGYFRCSHVYILLNLLRSVQFVFLNRCNKQNNLSLIFNINNNIYASSQYCLPSTRGQCTKTDEI